MQLRESNYAHEITYIAELVSKFFLVFVVSCLSMADDEDDHMILVQSQQHFFKFA